jgi:hypothetical protein
VSPKSAVKKHAALRDGQKFHMVFGVSRTAKFKLSSYRRGGRLGTSVRPTGTARRHFELISNPVIRRVLVSDLWSSSTEALKRISRLGISTQTERVA